MFKEFIETYAKAFSVENSLFCGMGLEDEFYGSPDRMEKTYRETFGYGEIPRREAAQLILLKSAQEAPEADFAADPIELSEIRLLGMCPHHFLPVSYSADFSYTPKRTRVGLSKIPRFFRYLIRFPVVQEDIGRIIVALFGEIVSPKAAKLTLRGRHFCMTDRGVAASSVTTTTSHSL